MKGKLIYPLLVLAGGIALAALLIASKPGPDADDYVAPPTTVRTVTVRKQAEYLTIRSQGTVQPRTESQLIPEVSGRVLWVSPSLVAGGSFIENEALLRIDEADYRNAVDRGKAVLTRASVEREHAQDELKRLKKLHAQKLASQSQLDEADRGFRVADANHSEARITLKQSERDLSRTEIVAPYAGRVRSEQVDPGQFVSRGNVIGTIYATDYVEVRLPISSTQLAYMNISTSGQIPTDPAVPVTISGDYGSVKFIWEGSLVRIEAEIDSRSRMLYGVARLKNSDFPDTPPLGVGLFVQAEIQGRRVEGIIRLPRSAMRDASQVLVVDEDGHLNFRQVKVLRIEHDEVLVSQGLEDGERVSVSPLQTVVDGMRVQAVDA